MPRTMQVDSSKNRIDSIKSLGVKSSSSRIQSNKSTIKKTKKRVSRNSKFLKEMRKLNSTNNLLLRKRPMKELMKEMMVIQTGSDYRITKNAHILFLQLVENHISTILKTSSIICKNRDRKILKCKDIEASREVLAIGY